MQESPVMAELVDWALDCFFFSMLFHGAVVGLKDHDHFSFTVLFTASIRWLLLEAGKKQISLLSTLNPTFGVQAWLPLRESRRKGYD